MTMGGGKEGGRMTDTEMMAKELARVTRSGKMENNERAVLSVKSFSYGVRSVLGAAVEEATEKAAEDATRAAV